MSGRPIRLIGFTLTLMLFTAVLPTIPALAQSESAAMAFHRTWERTDKPVADGVVSRTWMWGPDAASSQLQEEYAEAPGGYRTVIYSHKSRMEINHNPGVSPDSVWYVTNGLLVKELITGQMQMGDNSFVSRQPAQVNVAGDFDDPRGVTNALIGLLLDDAPLDEGMTINWFLTPTAASNIYMFDDALSTYGVTAARYVPETSHTVASPFWAFMNSSGIVYENGQFVHAPLFVNPFYATGFPITEAYWADVRVGGTQKDVLIQCFERRCLTYTPSNDPAWRVEAGNVGLHYQAWRYGQTGPQPAPLPNPDQYQPWIYGITVEDVIDYVRFWAGARGESCSAPQESGHSTVLFSCYGMWNGTNYGYLIQIYATHPEEVVSIEAAVFVRGGGIEATDAIASEVLGSIASLPYADSDPLRTAQTVVNNIRDGGYFNAGSANYFLNRPTVVPDLTSERNLQLVAAGYVCTPSPSGNFCY